MITPFLVLFILSPASPENLPSFRAAECAWRAEDVVVATEDGAIDGVLRVLETWGGELQPGARVDVPALAAWADAGKRAVEMPLWQERGPGVPAHVGGERMVLFLSRGAGGAFAPATPYRSWEASIAWIEGGAVYAHTQWINPGPNAIGPRDRDEADLRTEVDGVLALRAGLETATATEEPAARARAIAAFCEAELYLARARAFELLAGSGEAGAVELRAMLFDPRWLPYSAEVIEALVAADGAAAAPDVERVLAEERARWELLGPELPPGWWNTGYFAHGERDAHREHYGRLLAAVRCIPRAHSQGAVLELEALRDFWRSLPHLDEVGGSQIARACDEALASLHR